MNILPPDLGKVVSDGATGDSSAYNDGTGLGWKWSGAELRCREDGGVCGIGLIQSVVIDNDSRENCKSDNVNAFDIIVVFGELAPVTSSGHQTSPR